MADIKKPEHREPVAQEAKLVGDEAVYAETHVVEPEVNTDEVEAQVAGTPESPDSGVNVHETRVALDTVITDTSDPRAVQIPDAGRGSLDLPIHGLAAPTVEEVFADAATTPDERTEAESKVAEGKRGPEPVGKSDKS